VTKWTEADKSEWVEKIAALLQPILDPRIPVGCPLFVDPLQDLKMRMGMEVDENLKCGKGSDTKTKPSDDQA